MNDIVENMHELNKIDGHQSLRTSDVFNMVAQNATEQSKAGAANSTKSGLSKNNLKEKVQLASGDPELAEKEKKEKELSNSKNKKQVIDDNNTPADNDTPEESVIGAESNDAVNTKNNAVYNDDSTTKAAVVKEDNNSGFGKLGLGLLGLGAIAAAAGGGGGGGSNRTVNDLRLTTGKDGPTLGEGFSKQILGTELDDTFDARLSNHEMTLTEDDVVDGKGGDDTLDLGINGLIDWFDLFDEDALKMRVVDIESLNIISKNDVISEEVPLFGRVIDLNSFDENLTSLRIESNGHVDLDVGTTSIGEDGIPTSSIISDSIEELSIQAKGFVWLDLAKNFFISEQNEILGNLEYLESISIKSTGGNEVPSTPYHIVLGLFDIEASDITLTTNANDNMFIKVDGIGSTTFDIDNGTNGNGRADFDIFDLQDESLVFIENFEFNLDRINFRNLNNVSSDDIRMDGNDTVIDLTFDNSNSATVVLLGVNFNNFILSSSINFNNDPFEMLP